LFRAGELTCIYVPTEEDEAMQDLLCCRDDIRRAECQPAWQIVFQEYIDAADECTNRLYGITVQIQAMIPQWSGAPYVKAYQALRGVSLIVATTVVAEIGDMSRFKNPKDQQFFAQSGIP
jgi:transposase